MPGLLPSVQGSARITLSGGFPSNINTPNFSTLLLYPSEHLVSPDRDYSCVHLHHLKAHSLRAVAALATRTVLGIEYSVSDEINEPAESRQFVFIQLPSIK